MNIIPLDPDSIAVKKVIQDIDHLMNNLYAPESNQLLSLDELKSDKTYFIGAIENDTVITCGAIVEKRDDGLYGELKRIFVSPEHRGKGLSKKIMSALIEHATNSQWKTVRLETGNLQIEAIALYKKLGFKIRNEFGQYQYDPTSVYMELHLT